MPGQLVEVQFKGNRKAFYSWGEPEPLAAHEAVIVETDRGLDWGCVSTTGAVAGVKCARCVEQARAPSRNGEEREAEVAEAGAGAETGSAAETGRDAEPHPPQAAAPEPERRVVRRATAADTKIAEDLRYSEDDVRRKVREKVAAHRLQMKVSDAEWQWDKNRLTVYFTAELRPIGLQIAKDQRLSLNPTQISGACGRLLCCLRYEHEFYVQSRRRFPKEGKIVVTAKGNEKVVSIDIFRERVTLKAEDATTRVVPLADLKQEVEVTPAPLEQPPAPEQPTTGAPRRGRRRGGRRRRHAR